MKKALFIFILFILNISNVIGQVEGWNWVFGDGAGIHFNNGSTPNFIISSVGSIECSSAISDTSGNLLFYSGSTNLAPFNNLIVWNRFNQPMPNGNGVFGYGSATQGSLILNFPGHSDLFYLFSLKALPQNPLYMYYSVIDMSLDSGNGDVLIKNTILLPVELTEKMTAIRHGNGRDWWLLVHGNGIPTNKDFITFLITPNGISGPYIQNIPASNFQFAGDMVGQMVASQQGDQIAFAGDGGTLDIFEFDRCSGNLTLSFSYGFTAQTPDKGYYGCSFSGDGTKLYASQADGFGYDSLFQWDLSTGTKTLLWISPDSVSVGQHLPGPDGKIYIACAYVDIPDNLTP